MTVLIFVAVMVIAYFAWRIVDQLPDILYRLSEIQRDVADMRRRIDDSQSSRRAQPDAASEADTGTAGGSGATTGDDHDA